MTDLLTWSTVAVVAELPWGHRYAVVRPDHFRVDYVINPYMDPSTQPDAFVAGAQWQRLVATLETLGASVEVIEQRADAPDMVFAMNLGLAVTDRTGPRVVLSAMRFPERRMETQTAEDWFTATGFATSTAFAPEVGTHFEAGDAFPFAGELVVGFGPRTSEQVLALLAGALDTAVLGVRIVHPGMYHLDLAFCPLDERTALVCPAAFDAAGHQALLALVPDPVLLSEEEALTFCANSVVVGRTVVMPACPPRVRGELVRRGFAVELVDVSEFHRAGGSVRCLTNPLDIEHGRDLSPVPGGRVRLG